MVFNFLKDRIWSKIQGWSAKSLSRAGKAVLLRNVAQAVPSYAMSCFLLPKSLCQELERMMNSFWWGSSKRDLKGIRWLSWSNMSMPKCRGCVGFRDLHWFNLALLGKHCWHFLQNPSSLVARIFKARYYPNSSLFEASRGGGASFIWSGLWQAKEKIKHGFRWVVGDGKNIKVFEDIWLRDNGNCSLENTNMVRTDAVNVCDLFVPGTKNWDVQKVSSLFTNCDAEKILATRVPQNQVNNRIVWMSTADGKYSVKSGYRYWYDQNGSIVA